MTHIPTSPTQLGRWMAVRLGEPGTVVHVGLFVVLFLGFLIRAVVRVLSHMPEVVPEASAFGPCLPALSECVPMFKVHAHLLGFPLFLRVLRLTPELAWLAGPMLAAVFYPLLWAWLVARRQVPMLLASAMIIAIFNLPVLSGMSETPNGDVLTNILVISTLVLIIEFPSNAVLVSFFVFGAMLTHQRVLLIIPFLMILMYSFRHNNLRIFTSGVLSQAIHVSIPFIVALMCFFIFKEVFYYYLWVDYNIYNKLDIVSQIYRLLGIKGDPAVSGSVQEGGVFQFVLHRDNWIIWGPLYFTSFLGAFLHWRRGDQVRALTHLSAWLGTVAQLFVAEDVHRLTSFFFIGIILLASETLWMDSRDRRLVSGFLALGFAWVFLPNILR